jgi:glycosyltransferase involved in cell wall biosynthesis
VAVPLPVSAGTNIKLLEAMACGRAIVSTAAGCQGLDLESGNELLVADLVDFADAIRCLLRDKELRTGFAARARLTAERRFGWETIAEDALSCYVNLIDTPAGLPQPSKSRAACSSLQV